MIEQPWLDRAALARPRASSRWYRAAERELRAGPGHHRPVEGRGRGRPHPLDGACARTGRRRRWPGRRGAPSSTGCCLCVDPRGLVAAVLALTLYRGFRDTGYLDDGRAPTGWRAPSGCGRRAAGASAASRCAEAELLVLADPSARDADDAAVERGFRALRLRGCARRGGLVNFRLDRRGAYRIGAGDHRAV